MPVLTADNGPAAGQSFSFATRAVIGRGEMADVRIDVATLSRRHCEIRPGPEGWEVADLGSANGTCLNGHRVNEVAPLRRGDRIEVGDVTLVFQLASTQESPAVASGFTAQGSSPSALFQDVLSRIKLFCELGALPAAPGHGEHQITQALTAIRTAFPRLDHAAVLLHVSTGDRFTISSLTSENESGVSLVELAPRAREALRHERGRIAVGPDAGNGCWAALPIRYAGELIGVLYLASDDEPGALRSGDRDTLLAVAGMLACLVAPSRKPSQADVRDERDLALARRIQQRFLPQAPPKLAGYRIVDSYTAARVIGGDHFDYLALPDGRTVVIVADVSGKAVSGALYMARLGPMLNRAAAEASDLPALLGAVNRTLNAELEPGMFVTLLAIALEPDSSRIELSSAGHPPPFRRSLDGKVVEIDVPRGPPLGAVAEPVFQSSTVALDSGDVVVLFTDGLDEAHNAQQQLFGLERVVDVIKGADTGDAALALLLAALGQFVGEEPQSDDLTLVALQRL